MSSQGQTNTADGTINLTAEYIGNVKTSVFTRPEEVPLATKKSDNTFTLTEQGKIVKRDARAYTPLVITVTIESVILAIIFIVWIFGVIQSRRNKPAQ